MDYKKLIKITDGVGGGAKLEPRYFNSYDADEMGLDYETYKDFCEMNDIEPQAENSADFYDWQREMIDVDWEDTVAMIDDYDQKTNAHYIVEANIERWNGKHTAFQVYDSLVDAIDACISGADFIILDITEKGTIIVKGIHHDGTNVHEIKQMSDEAYERYEELDYEGEGLSFTMDESEVVPMC